MELSSCVLSIHAFFLFRMSQVFECRQVKCAQKFKVKSDLQDHELQMHKILPGDTCSICFVKCEFFFQHLITTHGSFDKKTHIFHSSPDLETIKGKRCLLCNHQKNDKDTDFESRHSQHYTCQYQYCSKFFKDLDVFRTHSLKSHDFCTLCDEQLSKSEGMTHFHVSHYHCEICNIYYSDLLIFKEHMIQNHSSGGKLSTLLVDYDQSMCIFCDVKVSKRSKNLDKHQDHWICPFCSYCTTMLRVLRAHLDLNHKGEHEPRNNGKISRVYLI